MVRFLVDMYISMLDDQFKGWKFPLWLKMLLKLHNM